MSCPKQAQVHRYYDGELPLAEREPLEAHLQECAECGRLLAELRRLSTLVAGATPAEIPAALVERLQGSWRAARDRSVLRLAGWMTAAAAAVLIGAVLVRHVSSTAPVSRPAIWETVAVTPPVDLPEEVNPDLAVLAQWMADDLSSGKQW
jgi:anti-sigma factor RsiW